MNRSRFRPKNTFDATGMVPRKGRYDSGAEQPLQFLRDRILRNVLIGSIIFGILAFIATLPPRLAERQYLQIGIFAVSLLTVIFVTINQRIPYKARVLCFLGLIAVLGITTLISDGLFGNGRIFLIALPILAALLISERAAIAALVASVVLVALSGVLMLLDVIPAPVYKLGNVNSDGRFWLLALAVWVLVGGVTTISLVVMLRGLKNLVDTEQRLRVELDSERATLANRVQERTRDLERRLNQIRAAAEISRSMGALSVGAVLEPAQMLMQVVNQLQKSFDYYFAGVYLVDDNKEYAVLVAGSGEAGIRMVSDGHQLPLNGESTVAWSITNHLPKIGVDVGRESAPGIGQFTGPQSSGVQTSVVRFKNTLLPFTRSELVLPIVVSRTESVQPTGEPQTQPRANAAQPLSTTITHTLGALVVHSTKSQAFDKDDLNVLQGIATSLANALENANLFQQVQKNLQEIRTLNRQYLEQAWSIQNKDLPMGKLAALSEDRSLVTRKQSYESDEAVPGWVSVQMPLEVRDQVIGWLDLEAPARSPNETRLSPEDQAMVDSIVTEAALALENVRLLETTQRRASFDRLLADITSTARAGNDLDAILRSTVRELGQALNAVEAEISLQVIPPNPDQPAPVAKDEYLEGLDSNTPEETS